MLYKMLYPKLNSLPVRIKRLIAPIVEKLFGWDLFEPTGGDW